MSRIAARPRLQTASAIVVVVAAGAAVAAYLHHLPRVAAIPFSATPVAESFRTIAAHGETDSLAIYRSADGQANRLFATDKHGHRIQVFDAATGRHLRDLGAFGNAPGQFNRPNGLAVWQRASADEINTQAPQASGPAATRSVDRAAAVEKARSTSMHGQDPRAMLFVVERDGRRVQAFDAGTLTPLCIFGVGELQKPYGVAVGSGSVGPCIVFVTDNHKEASKRVRRYEMKPGDSAPMFVCTHTFGDERGTGMLHLVESIAADPEYHRLYICDENRRQRNVKVYSYDGAYLGRTFGDGYISDDPEGLALWRQQRGGWIILTNQGKALSTFHLFDRETFEHVGAFVGRPPIANTDGVALTQGTLGCLRGGALYAVDNDGPVVAYAWADIATALRLPHRPGGAGAATSPAGPRSRP